MVGRVLNVPDAVIDQIEANKSEDSEKCSSNVIVQFAYSYRGLTHNFAILTSNCLQRLSELKKLVSLYSVFICLKTKKNG